MIKIIQSDHCFISLLVKVKEQDSHLLFPFSSACKLKHKPKALHSVKLYKCKITVCCVTRNNHVPTLTVDSNATIATENKQTMVANITSLSWVELLVAAVVRSFAQGQTLLCIFLM